MKCKHKWRHLSGSMEYGSFSWCEGCGTLRFISWAGVKGKTSYAYYKPRWMTEGRAYDATLKVVRHGRVE